ncbi:MAG: pyruvate dehydrogenase E2 component (dihydrolipoamide acetyltransferase) [Parasphingorhabdus sp.]|jgi:pyruvate dehydrogenase E2 component (dihydrolipoamide acetyltransferase)
MTDLIEIKIPDIGDFAEVEVIEVLVSPGDQVNAEDPLLTLESDKATMDVPSPVAGTVKSISVIMGSKVAEGSVIGVVEAVSKEPVPDESAITDSSNSEAPVAIESTVPAVVSEETHEGSEDEDDKQVTANRRQPPQSLPPPVQKSGGALPHASPGIRRFARELGANLHEIRGTGAKGRITKDDVKVYVKQQLSAPATPSSGFIGTTSGMGIPPIPEVDFSKFGDIEVKDTPRIKKLSGAHLHRSWLNIPHVTQFDDADITDLESFRKQVNSEQRDATSKVTLLAFVMKALSRGLAEFPLFNSSLSPDGQSLIFKKYFHIGIAVDTPNGLMVPVFRDVDQKGVMQLAKEMSETSVRAREGKLKPGDMQGGCMSISSLGGIGGTAFTPIVNAPEVAILGLSRSRMTPVWNGSEFEPRLMLPMSLSYDHRVVDGAEAARFSTYLGRALSDARRLLL